MQRADKRKYDQLREIRIKPRVISHAEGSCLFEAGNTKVICTASIDEKVPTFLRGNQSGWITAEYSMIPRATKERTSRESMTGKVSGRTYEIQRLIGRCLRSVVDLDKLGERTIWVDCDVIQADGGTRTASISGSFIAVYEAVKLLMDKKEIKTNPIIEHVAAVSVGIVDGMRYLDLTYEEDSRAQVDMNAAITESERIVEIQGTAETHPFSKKELDLLFELANKGTQEIIEQQKEAIKQII